MTYLTEGRLVCVFVWEGGREGENCEVEPTTVHPTGSLIASVPSQRGESDGGMEGGGGVVSLWRMSRLTLQPVTRFIAKAEDLVQQQSRRSF